MLDAINFFSAYQHDYHIYKLITLKQILENSERFEKEYLKEKIDGFDKKDFERVLKSEIRQSYFHAIETTFELIFALISDGEELDDKEILIRLSSSDWKKNYNKIKSISTEENGLKFLDDIVKVIDKVNGDEADITIGKYLFYYGILPSNKEISQEHLDLIDPSILAIKAGLKIIAQDFVNRDEYNSYKHALRVLPALKRLLLIDPETQKPLVDWDLSDSISYFTVNSQVKEIKFETKLFDTRKRFRTNTFLYASYF